MNLLFLNGYNNYFNRKLKKQNFIEDYIRDYNYEIRSEVNFNPNDGVKTTVVLNYDGSYLPDYVVVFDEARTIVSRWFIMDTQRTRNGQYQIRLQRDLVADFYDSIRNLPIFVQKGNLTADNPLIYNSEGMNFNQIKKDEIVLTDETKSAWIVGYVDRKSLEEVTIESTDNEATVPYIESLGISLVVAGRPENGGTIKVSNSYEYMGSGKQNLGSDMWRYSGVYLADSNTAFSSAAESVSDQPIFAQAKLGRFPTSFAAAQSESRYFKEGLDSYKTQLYTARAQFLEAEDIDYVSTEEYNNIVNLNGTVVYSSSAQKYYIINIGSGVNTTTVHNIDVTQTALHSALLASSRQFIEKTGNWNIVSNPVFQLKEKYTEYFISFTPTTGPGSKTVTLNVVHNHLDDAPYDMFCMQYTPSNLNLAANIINQLGSTLYDVQVLPYCPARFLMTGAGLEPELMGEEDKDYNIIKSDSGVDYLVWCRKSSQSFIINKPIKIAESAIDIKVANECETYRLCSPNYNGVFEFNAAKNDGVDYFNVYITYKPFSPYIQVAPNFKNLYGNSFKDARGLICNGDFSIAMTSDAWTQYEINNKNYENIFNTQIKTMDSQQDITRAYARWGIATGATQGAASGAAGGAMIGGGWGALAGGIIGTAASVGGGALDYKYQEESYQLNRQQTIDLWNYNLQNVKALPTSLNKVSAYTINNKLFPFVEYYSCTDVEKEAFKQKIRYNGMTVGVISTIADFENRAAEFNYFKGQLIQTSTLTDDYHIADALTAELERGIYLN